ncbi:glycoside hydrolase family 17 protein [Pelomicrobium sp.]|jgi:exo-beta-1,3-glucanase (GH17 family)|uniref:glycoside hydrolase family 17 protein n=1 Tax=Pelomicrobium sp. TaxID=2815319 RepID=UPI002FDE479D
MEVLRLPHGLVLAVLGLACAAAGHQIWTQGRPVPLPDGPAPPFDCVSYTPFRLPGESPFDPNARVSRARVEADLTFLSTRFRCVRTYSVSQGLAQVPAVAETLGMQVLLGVWLGRDREENERELALGLRTANAHPATVRAVIVGNEVLLRRELPEEVLRAYLERMRAATPLPVTYADVWEFWLRHPSLAQTVSFVTIHILPYWEDDPVGIERAVPHVQWVYDQVRAAFPGREIFIGETGWPSGGRQRQEAVPSRVNQARFVREFLSFAHRSGVGYNLIEAFDQPWKQRLEGTVGAHWGLYDGALRPKFSLQGPVAEDPHWRLGFWAAGGFALAFSLLAWFGHPRPGGRGLPILALAGFASGAVLAAPLRHLVATHRDPLEWALIVSLTALALVTVLTLAYGLARWAGRREPIAPPASLLPLLRSPTLAGDGLGLLRFVWLFAASGVALLLVFDPRYRDFPLALFGPPALGFLLHALAAGLEDWRFWPPAEREEALLATWLAASAPLIVAREGLANGSALLWGGLSLALAAAVLAPHAVARRGARARRPSEHQNAQ